MTVEAVCFDLDDTLFDYHDYARAGLDAAADRLEALTGERFHEELHDLYFDESVTEGTFDALLETQDLHERHDLPADVVDDLVAAFHGASAPLEPYPETTTVLSALDGYELGLITDGRGGHGKLDRLGLTDYFDSILVTPTIDSSKRDPEVFRHVLTDLAVRPERAVYVGDDPRFDVRVPNDLGMRTVRLRRGRYAHRDPENERASPDETIDSLDELLEVVDRPDPPEPEQD